MTSFFDVIGAHADAMPDTLAVLTEQDGTRTYALIKKELRERLPVAMEAGDG
jgi:hypothetical protein